ncbi:recombinase family protein, partial [Tissierella praeacuta]|uniref:recombinase family protein n=1 Tax=Tissierella praeacuta TaxID=43131 RepID=UPI003DA5EFC7
MKKPRAYGYARLSRDEDKENYDSIEMQVKIIENKAKDLDLELVDVKIDDNISGYTFNRDGLNSLKNIIEDGQVDVLIAKDLSRIGRHNAKTLLFLEFLEDNEVRLIADRYDSDKDDGDIIGIETWYNERYVKDISRKITTNIRAKQKNEGFIIRETFGYIRSQENQHKLVIDDIAANVVRRIFKMYIDGNGYRKIASILNEEKIPTPSQYMNSILNTNRPTADMWNSTHIKRILENEIYIGTLICHKTKKKKIGGDSIVVNESDNFIHENSHEGIIAESEFNLVQSIINKRHQRKIRGTEGSGINLFSGFLFCADCGSYMVMQKKRQEKFYICGNYHRYGKKVCEIHSIKEDELKNIMLMNFEQILLAAKESLNNIDKEIELGIKQQNNFNNLISKLKSSIENKQNEIKNYSKQLAKGLIDENMFKELTAESFQELNILNETLNDTLELLNESGKIKSKTIKTIDILNGIIENGDLTRKDIEITVDKIMVKQLNKIQTRGERPIIDLDITLNGVFNTMCCHNQVVV